MTKSAILLLCFASASFGQVPMASTRVREGAVTGLTAGLTAIDVGARAATNGYISASAASNYVNSAANAYVARFLPGLISQYTYPFTTNSVTFADDTTTTFGRLYATRIHTDEIISTGVVETRGTNVFETAFLWRTSSISNLLANDVAASWRTDIGALDAGSAEFPGASTTLRTPQVRADVLTSTSGSGGAIYAGTNMLSFAGDVYVDAGAEQFDKYRRPILVRDPVSGDSWYDPAYVTHDGRFVPRTTPFESRAFPLLGSTGYHALSATATNRVPLFGTGPPGMSSYSVASGFADMATTNGSYLLKTTLLPSAQAGLTFWVLMPSDPWDWPELPPFPELPPVVTPWATPPLPPLTPYPVPAPRPPSDPVAEPPDPWPATFYPANTRTNATLGTLNSNPVTFGTIYANQSDELSSDARTRAALSYCASPAAAFYGAGATAFAPFMTLSTTNFYDGVRLAGPVDVVIDVVPERYGPSTDQLSFSAQSTMTVSFERQLYRCDRVGSFGTPWGLTKISQTFTVRSYKQASGPSGWWMLDPGYMAWTGGYSVSQLDVSAVVEVSIAESDLPTNLFPRARSPVLAARGVGDAPVLFYQSGDVAYGFDSYGSTYQIVFGPDTLSYPFVSLVLTDSGTSLYDPGVPDYLARQFIYEDAGGVRTARSLTWQYTTGNWILWRDKTALYAQRVGEPSLRFLRNYDDLTVPVLDVSNDERPFVVDSTGSPGESGFGNPAVEILFTTSLAEEIAAVVPVRNATTGAASYTVTVKKRRPQ